MAHPYASHREDKAGKAKAKQLTSGKYQTGGAVSPGSGTGGSPAKQSAATDTKISGGKSAPRLDKFARGGAVSSKKDGKNIINIAVIGGGKEKEDEAPPMPPMPPMGAAPPPGPPPGGPPPGMPMSPGIGPGKPPGPPGFKKGGRVKMTAGAESGVGRLQKAGLKKRIR